MPAPLPLPSKFLQVAGSPFPRGQSLGARRGWARRKPRLSAAAAPAAPHPAVAAPCGVTKADGREGGLGGDGWESRLGRR